MDAARWTRIQAIFHDALDRPEADRKAFIDAACAGDHQLAREVQALVEEDTAPSGILEDGCGHIAGKLLEGSSQRSIGPYQLLAEAGRGGMGVVYLAERTDLQSRVAVKVLPNAWMSPARQARFTFEQRALAQLEHPSIARIYDAGITEDGTPWFAMEWVDGVPVTAFFQDRADGLAERLRMFREICEAVRHAHQAGLLHRDLKPSNILAKDDGSVRLLDFGIAKQMDAEDTSSDLTQYGLTALTLSYSAPELVRGKSATVQADVYSLGVILFELLARERYLDLASKSPAEAQAIAAAAAGRVPSQAASPVSGVSKAAWADLDCLCRTSMHFDLERRYASVEALIRDIDRFLHNEALEARPDEFLYKVRKFTYRNRRPLVVSALTAAVLLGVVIFFSLRLAAARDEAVAEAARAHRVQQFMLYLFQGGDEQAGPSKDMTVKTLVDRSAASAQMLTADPLVHAEVLFTLGDIYQTLGQLDRSAEMLTASLASRRRFANRSPALLVEILVTLGSVRMGQGKLDDAESLLLEAVALARTALPQGHLASISAVSMLGRVQIDAGRPQDGMRTLGEAQSMLSNPVRPTQEYATILMRLARAHFRLGDYAKAESLSQQVLDIYTKLYGESHPQVSDPTHNLGEFAIRRGQPLVAEKWFRRTVAINESFYGAEHPDTLTALRGLGQALAQQRKFAEAESVLKRVLAIRERTLKPNHPRIAQSFNALGEAEQGNGSFAKAQISFQRAAEIYRIAYGEKHEYVAFSLSNAAGALLEAGDAAGAERRLRDVCSRLEAVLPPGHSFSAIARARLGRALLRQGRIEEAKAELTTGLKFLEASAPDAAETAAARAALRSTLPQSLQK